MILPRLLPEHVLSLKDLVSFFENFVPLKVVLQFFQYIKKSDFLRFLTMMLK